MLGGALALTVAALGGMAYAVAGRSSSVFAPSVWRGPKDRREIALTFDDGPSASTPELLRVFEEYKVPATFFQCGMHVRKFPEIARQVVTAGHEVGNHTDTHPNLCWKSTEFLYDEIRRAQDAIVEVTGATPRLFRAPYGFRWFGLGEVQKRLGLLHVSWTTIGNDWKLDGPRVAKRVLPQCKNGAIICLHDARDRRENPDITSTLQAVKHMVPELLNRGYVFRTVSELLR
jgi:peptidoglycan/xylan/chitin deacetylase (PgdA/CDA1 family)